MSDSEEEDQLHLQQSSSTSSLNNEEEDGDNTTIETSYYNPSTVGIPPSSFLAPTTINNPQQGQASIRSCSLLDYTPPPPAYYHDMMYPPSYKSTRSSTKDNDNVSTL